jgi:probable HAF family extracellular repeat protein
MKLTTSSRTAAVLLALLAGSASAQHYRAIDLGTLGQQSVAWDIGPGGSVAGYSVTNLFASNFRGFLFSDGAMQDLGAGPATQSVAFCFGAGSDIFAMGYQWSDLTVRALRWRNGTLTTVDHFAPRGANPAGDVVGFLNVLAGSIRAEHACLWRNGLLTDLGTLGGNFSHAFDINTQAWIVGSSTTTRDLSTHACLWIGAPRLDLGTLGGANSQAYAINNNRQVVGWSNRTDAKPHAVLFTLDPSGGVQSRTDLGELGGGSSYAYAINERGAVVGASDGRAFLWSDGVLTDLNSRLPSGSSWKLEAATAIDDAGRIAGWGVHHGIPAAFLLECAADFNHDGQADFFDYLDFIAAFDAEDPAADFNADGQIDFFDYLDFVAAFGEGCG